MVLLICDSRIGRELDEIMRLDCHDVLIKVASGLRKILDNQIKASSVYSTRGIGMQLTYEICDITDAN